MWEYDFDGDANVVETYISYLRKKIDKLGPPLIHTIRGVGYTLRTPPRDKRAVTLRTRLLLALVAATAIGLAVAGIVTYSQQQTFLLNRVDEQVADASRPVLGNLTGGFGGFGGALGGLQYGTFGELRDANGAVVGSTLQVTERGKPRPQPPVLPAQLTATADRHFDAHAAHGGTHYRVLATPIPNSFGLASYTLVVAVPLTDVDQTLHHLFLVELLVAGSVLLALALMAWWVVRLGLRPLEQMGETAGAIADGDLSRRVEPADEKTEVGRLGLALNSMLSQIEVAFAERTASEARLRRFVADASHELRTPLTSIRGYAELFRRGAELAARRPREDDAAHRGGGGAHGRARRRPAPARAARPGPPARPGTGGPDPPRRRGRRRSPGDVSRPPGRVRRHRVDRRERRRIPAAPGAREPARERAHATRRRPRRSRCT